MSDIFEYDVSLRISGEVAAELSEHLDPIVTFSGVQTPSDWLHEEYALTEEGLRYRSWWSSDPGRSHEARVAESHELKARVLKGETPVAEWSNLRGLFFLNKVVNDLTEEERLKRIRQVRDALNKCHDIVRIEAAARLFGL